MCVTSAAAAKSLQSCPTLCNPIHGSPSGSPVPRILQARLQQYVNRELLDVQAGFRKGRGTRDQIPKICWIIEKAREFQKNIYLCFINYTKAFDCVYHNKLWKTLRDGNAAAAAIKSLQSCPTLCNPIDGSPPGSSVPGILQARTLEWVAISFSNA